MRDQLQDKKVGKNTLVVYLGSQKAKIYHYTLIIGAIACALYYVNKNYSSPLQYLFLITTIPMLLNIITVGKNILFRELDPELKKVALSTFLFAILFSMFN